MARDLALPKDFRVAIGMPCGSHVPYQTMLSLARTTGGLIARGIPYDMLCVAGSSIVSVARNAVLTLFLDTTKADVLFWIDSDMSWSLEDFLYLCALSSKFDIVSGLYPSKTTPPHIILNTPGDEYELNSYGLVKTTGTGLGFTVMRRAVLEKWVSGKVKEATLVPGGERNNYKAFTLDKAGEDVQMFRELRDLGYTGWVDPSVKLGHIGTYEYRIDPLEELGLTEVYKQHQLKG